MRVAPIVPAPAEGPMHCPGSVAGNREAKANWDLYLANAAPGHLAPIDGPLLARLCMALARAEAAEATMGTNLLIKFKLSRAKNGDPDQVRISPLLTIVNEQTEIARRLAAELALPPAQRNRIGISFGGPAAGTDAGGFHITIGDADRDL